MLMEKTTTRVHVLPHSLGISAKVRKHQLFNSLGNPVLSWLFRSPAAAAPCITWIELLSTISTVHIFTFTG